MKVGLFINTQFPEGFKLEVCIPAGPAGHLQSEYMVPRANATAAIANLRSIGDRIDRHLWTTEIRSMAGDRLWLSPSYGDNHVGIHFSWRREPYAVQAISAEIETMLLQFGARPHWGKIIHAPAEQLAPLYPKLLEFRELARSYDPGGSSAMNFSTCTCSGEALEPWSCWQNAKPGLARCGAVIRAVKS